MGDDWMTEVKVSVKKEKDLEIMINFFRQGLVVNVVLSIVGFYVYKIHNQYKIGNLFNNKLDNSFEMTVAFSILSFIGLILNVYKINNYKNTNEYVK